MRDRTWSELCPDEQQALHEQYLAELAADKGWEDHVERFWSGQIGPRDNVEYGFTPEGRAW